MKLVSELDVGPSVNNSIMIKLEVPKTPAKAWRELPSEDRAFRVGLMMRVAWEITKPVIAWTAFILLMGAWAVSYAIFKALFSK